MLLLYNISNTRQRFSMSIETSSRTATERRPLPTGLTVSESLFGIADYLYRAQIAKRRLKASDRLVILQPRSDRPIRASFYLKPDESIREAKIELLREGTELAIFPPSGIGSGTYYENEFSADFRDGLLASLGDEEYQRCLNALHEIDEERQRLAEITDLERGYSIADNRIHV